MEIFALSFLVQIFGGDLFKEWILPLLQMIKVGL
jgi:hypothetical protein